MVTVVPKKAFDALNKKVTEDSEKRVKFDYEDFKKKVMHYTFVKDSSVDANVREYHKQVIGGLLRSIRDSGKGISKETAMYVINIGEEYDFIYFSGMKPMMQSLINENGRQFDVMDTEDREGNKYRLYFEVTDFFGHY